MLCDLGQHVIFHFLFLAIFLSWANHWKHFYMVFFFTDLGVPLHGLLCPGLLQYPTLVPSGGHSLLPGYNIPLFLPPIPRHIPQRSKCQLDQAGKCIPHHVVRGQSGSSNDDSMLWFFEFKRMFLAASQFKKCRHSPKAFVSEKWNIHRKHLTQLIRSETKYSEIFFCCLFCFKFSCLQFWAREGMRAFLKSPGKGLFAGASSFALWLQLEVKKCDWRYWNFKMSGYFCFRP